MSDQQAITGGCLCGSVRYRVTGSVLWCSHCHCSYCRAAHGAALVTWFGIQEHDFMLESGKDSIRWYPSSQWSRRGFCPECGTSLFFQSRQSPGQMHVALATTDPGSGIRPTAHVFYDRHVDWLETCDELPRIDSGSETLAAYRQIPVLNAEQKEPSDD